MIEALTEECQKALEELEYEEKKKEVDLIDDILSGYIVPTKKLLLKKSTVLDSGDLIAHRLALYGYVFYDIDILKLKNKYGESVAWHQALFSEDTGWATHNPSILHLVGPAGLTVAHCLADLNRSWITSDSTILALKDNTGESVRDVLIRKKKL